jgi:hypothetical protein
MNSNTKFNIANTITYAGGLLLCIFAMWGLVKAWYFEDNTIDICAHWVVCAMGVIIMFFSMFAQDEQKKSRKQ